METVSGPTEEDLQQEEEEEEDATSEESILPPERHVRIRCAEQDFHRSGKLKSVQAIVLAGGPGSRMSSLLASKQKWELPIATIPMLYYPLHMLQSAGFTECEIVVAEGSQEAITAMLEQYGLIIHLNFHTIDPSEDPGTADSIRQIIPGIYEETNDIIIVSGDLISKLDVAHMLSDHRLNKGGVTMLTASYDTRHFTATPGVKQKSNIGPDVLFHEMTTGCIVRSVSGGDYEKSISMPYGMHQNSTILPTTNVTDHHLYIIKRKILVDYVFGEQSVCRNMTSLKVEVVPHLIDMQLHPNPHKEYVDATAGKQDFFAKLISSRNGSLRARTQSGKNVHSYHYDDDICIRANNIPAYWHINTIMPLLLETHYPECGVKIGDTSKADVKPKAVIKGHSVIGAGCTVHDKTTLTNTTLGDNCVVSPYTRLTNCLVYDNVTIGSGCVLDNTIVCCTIDKEKCTTKSCIISSAQALHSEKSYKSETLDSTQYFGQ